MERIKAAKGILKTGISNKGDKAEGGGGAADVENLGNRNEDTRGQGVPQLLGSDWSVYPEQKSGLSYFSLSVQKSLQNPKRLEGTRDLNPPAELIEFRLAAQTEFRAPRVLQMSRLYCKSPLMSFHL